MLRRSFPAEGFALPTPYRTVPSLHEIPSLGDTGRVSDLALLVPLLPPARTPLAADAARAVDAILRRATLEDIAWLARHRPAMSQWALRPADLGSPPDEAPGTHASLIALASFHPSGYVRERAVRLLAWRRDGSELPYLLLRVNDWVVPVRVAAGSALHARIEPSYAEHFARCLPLVDDLRGARRAEHRPLTDAVEAFLCTDVAAPAVEEVLRTGTRAQRRACARIMAPRATPALLLHAATERDPVVATTA